MNLGEQICCVLSEKLFETFTPIWSHVSENEKKKWQNPKFHNSLNNFGKDPPQEYA